MPVVPTAEDPQPASAPPEQPEQRATRAGRRGAREAGRPVDPASLVATHPAVVLATAALALLVSVSATSGQAQTGLALAFLGIVLGWGWPVLLGAPSPVITSVIIGIGAVAVEAVAALTRNEPFLRWVPVAAAVSMLAAFLHQILRRDGRARLTYGAATTISGLALATTGAPLAVLPAYRSGGDYVLAAGAALALGALVELLGHWPGWRRWLLLPVIVAGAVGALGVALAVGHVPMVAAAILGVLVAAVSHALRRVLTPLPGAGALQARMAMGAASVLVVGVVVYLVTRLVAA